MTASIVWFRQDLRINDNPALSEACKLGKILPIYIYDTSTEHLGGASKWALHHALASLNDALEGKLLFAKGNPKEILLSICEEHHIEGVYWNRMYEENIRQRDADIKSSLRDKSINAMSFNGSLLWEPMEVLKKDNTPYKVFTPYYKNGCLNQREPRYPLSRPNIETLTIENSIDYSCSLNDLALLPKISWDEGFDKHWTLSEKSAQDRLAQFINERISEYSDQRNIPSVKGTSRLSPYLHFGLISPNQAWYAVLDAFDGNRESEGVSTFLSELGWREFSYYLLFHFDALQSKNFNPKFDHFPWENNQENLVAWQRGNTGIPIVDAGMRELWQTGYMHNRVRMIVGSFLVKNLGIDWRKGERWFWDCLLDADTASNSASWQWVAGSGADAAPFFRIFNPVLQGEKFDKQGDYVKKYCPELKHMPNKYIHKPWDAPSDALAQANLTLGKQYPKPVVDLKSSRQKALDAYSQIK